MEYKFNSENIDMDLQLLRNFCEQEGEAVSYRKGERMESEGEPAHWFGFVAEGCFKYTVRGFSNGKEHLTWFCSVTSMRAIILLVSMVTHR